MKIMIQRIKLNHDHGWSLRLYWLLGTQFFIDFMEYFHVIGIPIKMIILVVTHRINTIFLLSSIRKIYTYIREGCFVVLSMVRVWVMIYLISYAVKKHYAFCISNGIQILHTHVEWVRKS